MKADKSKVGHGSSTLTDAEAVRFLEENCPFIQHEKQMKTEALVAKARK